MLGPLALLVLLAPSSPELPGGASTAFHAVPAHENRAEHARAGAGAALAVDWIADTADSICGLSDLRTLSLPAKVDYDRLWSATPEIKELVREGIDPESPAGIRLQQKATDRIREAADNVREDKNHCSVWKKIRHKDGRRIPDITEIVEEKFPDELDD